MTNKGFLLVLMQPPPTFEEEFNEWYDTEHVPERLAVPGFESGLRYVCIAGTPRYLAMYDLARPQVLETPEYLRVSLERSSPWTRRVTSKVRIYRSAGQQVYPGDALTGRAARVLLLRFRALPADAEAAVVEGMRASFEGRRETRRVRVFANDTGDGVDFLGFVEAQAPLGERLDLDALREVAEALDLVNTYAPY
ncbi:MAG: hypothetical protein ACREH3_05710 [Geminicoccales bacterium]